LENFGPKEKSLLPIQFLEKIKGKIKTNLQKINPIHFNHQVFSHVKARKWVFPLYDD
jgi:hypothetical protein